MAAKTEEAQFGIYFYLESLSINIQEKKIIFILVGVLFGSFQYHCRGAKQHSIQPQQQQKIMKKCTTIQTLCGLMRSDEWNPPFIFC